MMPKRRLMRFRRCLIISHQSGTLYISHEVFCADASRFVTSCDALRVAEAANQRMEGVRMQLLVWSTRSVRFGMVRTLRSGGDDGEIVARM
jgi:hypothetical protein